MTTKLNFAKNFTRKGLNFERVLLSSLLVCTNFQLNRMKDRKFYGNFLLRTMCLVNVILYIDGKIILIPFFG